jgi:biopolymer transport protein ExbB/TolQ
VLRAQLRELETFIPILGTIGSIAPFVGLLGTVVGIIKAFKAISTSAGAAGPEVVSGGISEALLTTAAGLAVAIPAVLAYNFYITRLRRLAEEIDLAAFEAIEWLAEHEEKAL